MPTSPMLDKGPCEIVWDWNGENPAYLGRTLGGVKLTMETNVSDINEDQAGDAPVNAVMTGSVTELEATLTRLSVEQLARVLHSSASGCVIPIYNQVGCDLYDEARELMIMPLCGNEVVDDPCTWIHIYRAYPVAGLDLTWDKDTQRIFPVKFKIFPCQDSDCPIGKIGTVGVESGASFFGFSA